MSSKRPAKRFSVIIEDGADNQHVMLVRGHDLDGAIRQAVKRLKRDILAGNIHQLGLGVATRALKRFSLKRIFAGHVREVGKGNIDVTNL